MRISDWSSDVCSSDLLCPVAAGKPQRTAGRHRPGKEPGAQHLHFARAGAAGVGPSLGRRDQDGVQGFRVLADTTSDQAHSILPGSPPTRNFAAPGEQSTQPLTLSRPREEPTDKTTAY